MLESSDSLPDQDERRWFEGLVQVYGVELRCFCLRLTSGRGALADEALQAAYQCAWNRRATFKGGNARAWLYQIARYEAYNLLKKEDRHTPLAPDALRSLLEAQEAANGEAQLDALSEDEAPPDPRLVAMRTCYGSLEPTNASIVALSCGLRSCSFGPDAPFKPTYLEIAGVLEAETGTEFTADQVRMALKRTLAALLKCVRRRLILAESKPLEPKETRV